MFARYGAEETSKNIVERSYPLFRSRPESYHGGYSQIFAQDDPEAKLTEVPTKRERTEGSRRVEKAEGDRGEKEENKRDLFSVRYSNQYENRKRS